MKYPNLLIISHNLFDKTNNIGKTLVALLDGWPKECISQIYLTEEKPSFKYCNKYYQILDKDVVAHVFNKNKIVGNCLDTNNNKETKNQKAIVNNLEIVGHKRIPTVSLIRDIIWKTKPWLTPAFEEWIRNVAQPDLVLFVPNDYVLAYDIAFAVSRITDKPLVPFYMDDAFYYGCTTTLIDYIRRRQLRSAASKIHVNVNTIFTICNAMSNEYNKLFNLECCAFVNSIRIDIGEYAQKEHDPLSLKLTYTGNLHSNRWKSLFEVGMCLDKINDCNNTNHVLTIISRDELTKPMRKHFEKVKCLVFKHNVSLEELKQLQNDSDILLYTESFKRKDINNLRLSFSTKIPEYLSSNVAIFAYGPMDLAAIQYFKETNLAEVCISKRDLESQLLAFINSPDKRKHLASIGLIEAKKYDVRITSENFKELLIAQLATNN